MKTVRLERFGFPLALALVVMLTACGVKGPPKPLWAPPPLSAIKDLAHRVDDGKLALSWQLASPLTARQAEQACFIVRRSRSPLDEPACETCPQVFETVGQLPYVESEGLAFTLKLPLEAGYRYLFKVHLEAGGEIGLESDPLEFDVPVDETAASSEEP